MAKNDRMMRIGRGPSIAVGVGVVIGLIATLAVFFSLPERGSKLEEVSIQRGRELVQEYGCLACHSQAGEKRVGPTFAGLFQRERRLASGETVTADEPYLRESILNPNAEIVGGFDPDIMPKYYKERLSEEELKAIIEYIKSLKE